MAVLMSCFRCSKPILVSEEKIAAGQIPYCTNCRDSLGIAEEQAAAKQRASARPYKVAKKGRGDKAGGARKEDGVSGAPAVRTGLFVFVLCIFLALGALGLFGVSVLVMLITNSAKDSTADTARTTPPIVDGRTPPVVVPLPAPPGGVDPPVPPVDNTKPPPVVPAKTVREERMIVAAPGATVAGVAFSPDGSIVVTASGGLGKLGQIRFWKATTGVTSPVKIAPGSELFGVAVRSKGDLLASAGGVSGVQLYNNEGKILGAYKHPSYVRAVAFSPDGPYLASSCEHQLKVFDLATQTELWTGKLLGLIAPWHGPTQIAFSPDGKVIACGDGGINVVACETTTGKMLFVGEGHTKPVICATYSPDGKYLASGGFDETVRVWDTETGKTVHLLEGHQGAVHSLAFARDNRTLATAGGDGSVILWDVSTGQKITTLQAHQKSALCVAFPPRGNLLASSGADGMVRLWDVSRVVSVP